MTSLNKILEQQQPQKPKKTLAEKLNTVRNIVMALAFLIMGVLMIFPTQLKVEMLLQFSELKRYLFGGICVLYGGFRIFRAFLSTNN